MPVKRRAGKRRLDPAGELAAWSVLFEDGHDYFHDLDFPNDDAAREAAREAWKRLGRQFLAQRREDEVLKRRPWALKQFGDPDAC